MKTLKSSFFPYVCIPLFAGLIFSGCHKGAQQNQTPSLDTKSIPQVLYGAYLGELRLPDQTTTEILNGGSTVRFHFPKGIYLVGTDSTGQIRMLTETDYTCTGACTQGCDVFYIRGHFGCSQCEPGTISCTGHSSSLSGLEGYGFVDLKQGIHFVKDTQEIHSLFDPPNGLFDIPAVRQAMEQFNIQNYGQPQPDFSRRSAYREVAVNLFGCLVTYLVPKSGQLRSDVSVDQLIDASSWYCHCDEGNTDCTPESGLGYKMCKKGGCTSCRMHIDQQQLSSN
ncbi:hypothetical protein BXY57_0107 [Thermoflavifilum aggregans]|uniref:Uncharacterized protein n=1 Tax=Thermoflavifilum aggregans TaxID=454188 RepID=A0A2M9CRN6_9BACT|nr:hypothetical protein [Thermoflavifilum aggregans]PJJ74549.1 hypothetical protein BXY57_0107 [Thermoflavifilum aggregans]